MWNRRTLLRTAALAPLALKRPAYSAATPGVTATEIKIGNTMPYSGPASAYGVEGTALAAYFRMINDRGGINGRKITFISLDDGYSPPRTLEQTRRLVEEQGVAFLFQGLGTPTQTAVRPYLNANGVPQLFVGSPADKWADPEDYHWTIGFNPSYRTESAIYGRYILQQKPNAKIGVLYQNDDFGRDVLIGLKRCLGEADAAMLVKEVSYEPTDPTIDSQIVTLQSAGADVIITAAIPKFAAQTIRKLAELDWKPLHILASVSSSLTVLKQAGLENATGLISARFVKDNTDRQWADDPGMNEWRVFMKTYLPNADSTDLNYVWPYAPCVAVTQVLRQCGNDLARENVMRQAADLHDVQAATLLPGIMVNTDPTNYRPIRAMRMQRFNGQRWELFGSLISS
jgi:branched-chain amino acid transport system substrate-binding protein